MTNLEQRPARVERRGVEIPTSPRSGTTSAAALGSSGRPEKRKGTGSARGTQRERAVRDLLTGEDWLAFRAPASLGCADVVALRDGNRPRLVEVKSTAGGPYERFGPDSRQRLSFAARLAGADAYLAWWPPRGKLIWIKESAWPKDRRAVVA